MPAVAALLLGIALLLAAFGTGAYLACALGDPRPDPETLRLARLAAAAGRRIGALGLTLWFGTGHAANPGMSLLLALTAAAATATYVTKIRPANASGTPA